MPSKRKRPQAQKPRNKPLNEAMQEKRFGNAAAPHKNKSKYDRRDKSWKDDR